MLSATKYDKELQAELNRYLELMEATWGEMPDIRAITEPGLVVNVGFNIVGFAHKGRKIYIHPGNVDTRRTPARVAHEIVAELTDHRNTCQQGCGVGKRATGMRHSLALHPERYVYLQTQTSSPYYTRYAPLTEEDRFDAVERAIHPRRAREVDKVLDGLTKQPKGVLVRFHPQAWQRNYAIDVDPEGEVEWHSHNVTEAMESNTHESDELRLDNEAPEWVQSWDGPFWIELVR